MGGNGLVNPGADRNGVTICLTLKVGIMWMNQTEDEKRIDQQIEAERRYRKGPQGPGLAGWSI